MGNLCGYCCGRNSEETELITSDDETRRSQMAEAAVQREQVQNNDIEDPESIKKMEQRARDAERREREYAEASKNRPVIRWAHGKGRGLELCPKEILEKIFNFCESRELLNLTATCWRFNEIINSNVNMLKKFEIKVRFGDDESKDFEATRRYFRLYINSLHPVLPKIIDQTRNDLTDITFMFVRIDCRVFKNFLMDCTKLKKLIISNVIFSFTDECFLEPLPEFMLDKLICSSDRNILKLLRLCQTKKFVNACYNLLEGEVEALKSFLKNQQHLVELKMFGFDFDCGIFHDDTLSSVDFRLEHLRISGFGDFHFGYFSNFLENHQESLAHVVIGQMVPNNCPVLKMYQILVVNSLKNMYNMKSLVLRNIFLHFDILPYVEKLELQEFGLIGDDANWNLKFPNVNHLILNQCERTNEVAMLKKLHTLELIKMTLLEELEIPQNVIHLRMHNVDVFFGFNYDFQVGKIETLKLEHCKNAEWLVNFLNGLTNKLKLLKLFKVSLDRNLSFTYVFNQYPILKEKAERIIIID